MNIRLKLMAIVAVALLITIPVLYYFISGIMLESYRSIENQNADIHMNSVTRSFIEISEDFSNKMNDWALWDDTYNFARDRNRRYIESNISYESMRLLNIDFLFMVCDSNEIILDCFFDHKNQKIISASDGFKRTVMQIAGALDSEKVKTRSAKLVSLDSRPAMIASNLILTSQGDGPARGFLIYGHFIDEGEADKINRLTALNISFSKIVEAVDCVETNHKIFDVTGEISYSAVKKVTPDYIECNVLFNDIYRRPLFLTAFKTSRSVYNQGLTALKIFIAALISSGIMFFIFTSYFINRFVIGRIIKLSGEVKNMPMPGGFEAVEKRVCVEGDDEIASLSSEINLMLEKIDGSAIKMNRLFKELDAAVRAKSDFLGNIGHELRTPITCIIGYADMLSDMPLEGEMREFVNRIKLSGHILVSTVNDILDYISIEGGVLILKNSNFEITSVFDEITGYAKFIASEKNLSFISSIDENLKGLKVIGDETRLKQIILNLSGNAIKFTESGFIEIGASLVMQTESEVLVKIFVKDSGVGISEEKQSGIFMPFVQSDNSSTRKYGGAGLGLAIANHLVKLMGGEKICLDSKPGCGSNFYFNIKLTKSLN